MSQPDIHVDPNAVLSVYRARSMQQIDQLLDEVARLTVYASALQDRIADMESPKPDAWGDHPTNREDTAP